MARKIDWDGEPFALLIESAIGNYLVPPLVLDPNGGLLAGQQILAAIVYSGETVSLPVIQGGDAGMLAEVDRRMAELSERFGVPIGPR